MNDVNDYFDLCHSCCEVHDTRVECWEKTHELEDQAELDLCPKAANGVHQYFEIRKIGKHSERQQKTKDEAREKSRTAGYSVLFLFDVQGVLVKCALCSNQKELWEGYEENHA